MANISFKKSLLSRAFLFTGCLSGFAGIMHCDAQSIWENGNRSPVKCIARRMQ